MKTLSEKLRANLIIDTLSTLLRLLLLIHIQIWKLSANLQYFDTQLTRRDPLCDTVSDLYFQEAFQKQTISISTYALLLPTDKQPKTVAEIKKNIMEK